ncbi:MAG: hypothetical protein MJE68_04505 [Proteobacteria bacterium]|nr:hypothetical protein [Pseudomonadota bacterium]
MFRQCQDSGSGRAGTCRLWYATVATHPNLAPTNVYIHNSITTIGC